MSTNQQALIFYLVSSIIAVVAIKLYKRFEYGVDCSTEFGIGDAIIPVWNILLTCAIVFHYSCYLAYTFYHKTGLNHVIDKINNTLMK